MVRQADPFEILDDPRRGEDVAVHGHALESTGLPTGPTKILLQLLQAYGGPGRRAVIPEPTYLLHARLPG